MLTNVIEAKLISSLLPLILTIDHNMSSCMATNLKLATTDAFLQGSALVPLLFLFFISTVDQSSLKGQLSKRLLLTQQNTQVKVKGIDTWFYLSKNKNLSKNYFTTNNKK